MQPEIISSESWPGWRWSRGSVVGCGFFNFWEHITYLEFLAKIYENTVTIGKIYWFATQNDVIRLYWGCSGTSYQGCPVGGPGGSPGVQVCPGDVQGCLGVARGVQPLCPGV